MSFSGSPILFNPTKRPSVRAGPTFYSVANIELEGGIFSCVKKLVKQSERVESENPPTVGVSSFHLVKCVP